MYTYRYKKTNKISYINTYISYLSYIHPFTVRP